MPVWLGILQNTPGPVITSMLFIAATAIAVSSEKSPDQSHGLSYPSGWQNWSTIAVSHRTDNETVRVILGNEVAKKPHVLGKQILGLMVLF